MDQDSFQLALSQPAARAEVGMNSAAALHRACSMPDIGDLLVDLNDKRKHEAYGDIIPLKICTQRRPPLQSRSTSRPHGSSTR